MGRLVSRRVYRTSVFAPSCLPKQNYIAAPGPHRRTEVICWRETLLDAVGSPRLLFKLRTRFDFRVLSGQFLGPGKTKSSLFVILSPVPVPRALKVFIQWLRSLNNKRSMQCVRHQYQVTHCSF